MRACFFTMTHKKTALITGGTSGIGLAAAKLLTEKGYRVALMARSSERGKKAVDYLGGDALFFAGDVTKSADCDAVAARCAEHFGRLDVLINSAGVYAEASIEDTSEEMFDTVMAVNMKGTFLMCRAVAPLLKVCGGAVVNVSSDAGVHGNYNCAIYSASKGAVALFTRSLALEFAAFNVRVNAVAPGDIMTPMTEKQLSAAPEGPETALKLMHSVYPLGRIGTAQEAAAVAVFLATEDASFVTGAIWGVDGGLTA